MSKYDFNNVFISDENIALSKNEKIKKSVSNLFNDINSDKIEKIIQATLAYNDIGLVGGCLNIKTLSKKDIKKNRFFFSILNPWNREYIDITEEGNKKILFTINETIYIVLSEKSEGCI
jgi:hypothetical protein